MARFRGAVQGNRGEATRLGHRSLQTECNGWTSGVDVVAEGEKHDTFTVRITAGSGGQFRPVPIFRVEDTKDGLVLTFSEGDAMVRGLGSHRVAAIKAGSRVLWTQTEGKK